jgi:hypothetical protein
MHAFQIIALLFIAIIFGKGIRPVVTWLYQHHIPCSLGTLIVYLRLFIVLGGMGYRKRFQEIERSIAFCSVLWVYLVYDGARMMGVWYAAVIPPSAESEDQDASGGTDTH